MLFSIQFENYCVHLFSLKDKVHIPGAIYLSVKFDSRCYTEEGCDELLMSSSSDFLQDVHNFSGSPQKWSDFEIPGKEYFDKVVYSFFTLCILVCVHISGSLIIMFKSCLSTCVLCLGLSQEIPCTTDLCQT